MKEKILIVEDQFIEANNLQRILEKAGYSVCGIARSVPAAIKLLDKERPDLVLLDIYLQGPLTGIDLAKRLRDDHIAFIYLSANSNKDTLEAAKATRPYGFLVKPFREKDVLVMLEIARYLHQNNLASFMRKESDATSVLIPQHLQQATPTQLGIDHNFYGIIGRSEGLLTLLHHLQLVAPSDTSVLIMGETGTGKERVAECVHELSNRKSKPLVKVNCAALPPTLIESVLFGHEKGSFTGANERRIGKFEQAHKGSIFLDEIGELPLEAQVKLLRVLQEKEIERLGGNETIKTDVRIIAATNRDLEKEVAAGRFRIDLYYRLHVFPLLLPALRERKEDIPLLAQHFIRLYAAKLGKHVVDCTPQAMDVLLSHTWPGNVRELEHVMERAVLLADDSLIKKIALAAPKTEIHRAEEKVKTMEENERDYIITVLNKCNGKIFGKGGAAEMLGMNVSTLNSRIKKLGIEK